MSFQQREAKISWVQDLNASTSTTVFPSGASAGVPTLTAYGRGANRVHVGVDYRVASGTMSVQLALYGYTQPTSSTVSGSWSTATWVYLGALNGGASITTNTATWSESATHIAFAEVFSVAVDNYDRFATRAYGTGGSSPLVSTYVGFAME